MVFDGDGHARIIDSPCVMGRWSLAWLAWVIGDWLVGVVEEPIDDRQVKPSRVCRSRRLSFGPFPSRFFVECWGEREIDWWWRVV
jgi:hypothetical protein